MEGLSLSGDDDECRRRPMLEMLQSIQRTSADRIIPDFAADASGKHG